MFSMPPATTIAASPRRIASAAIAIAFSPEPQSLLIVVAGTSIGSPARIAACRAGPCPTAAVRTIPMITSSTCAGAIPARRSASAITSVPNSIAVTSASAPPNDPIGVRAAPTITASWICAVLMIASQLADGSRQTAETASKRGAFRMPPRCNGALCRLLTTVCRLATRRSSPPQRPRGSVRPRSRRRGWWCRRESVRSPRPAGGGA